MSSQSKTRLIEVRDMTAPCVRLDIDLAEDVPDISSRTAVGDAHCAWLLVRTHGLAVGVVTMAIPPEGLSRTEVLASVTEALGTELRARLGVPTTATSSSTSKDPSESAAPPVSAHQGTVDRTASITAVVCTRGHPEARPTALQECLESLVAQRYQHFSILVIDNAPTDNVTRGVVETFLKAPVSVKYLVERRPGLSWARNRALEAVGSEVVAWIDDDEVADANWLSELARGFRDHDEATAVSGMMLPAELDLPAQVWFEQWGSRQRHRGFVSVIFSTSNASIRSPFYPFPPFGHGGNMAMRVDALRAIGGFDPALGTGTVSMGAEDTRIFTDLLCAGGAIVFQPSAITHHFHRPRKDELRRQIFGYGAGTTAYYAALLLSRPRTIWPILRLVPVACRDLLGSDSPRRSNLPGDFPADLRRAYWGGLASGPVRYLWARQRARRLRALSRRQR